MLIFVSMLLAWKIGEPANAAKLNISVLEAARSLLCIFISIGDNFLSLENNVQAIRGKNQWAEKFGNYHVFFFLYHRCGNIDCKCDANLAGEDAYLDPSV